MRLTKIDQENVRIIVRSGQATTTTGAIRLALAQTAVRLAQNGGGK